METKIKPIAHHGMDLNLIFKKVTLGSGEDISRDRNRILTLCGLIESVVILEGCSVVRFFACV